MQMKDNIYNVIMTDTGADSNTTMKGMSCNISRRKAANQLKD
jgi:hypothetical protein